MTNQEWLLYEDDGHIHFNIGGRGTPIPTPPKEIQVLISQKDRIDVVLAAYATLVSNRKYGEDLAAEEYFNTCFEEYLSNEAPYSRRRVCY